MSHVSKVDCIYIHNCVCISISICILYLFVSLPDQESVLDCGMCPRSIVWKPCMGAVSPLNASGHGDDDHLGDDDDHGDGGDGGGDPSSIGFLKEHFIHPRLFDSVASVKT